MKKAVNIDEYISDFPDDVQLILQKIRSTVKSVAPDAVEAIKYSMPAFILHGNLIYFAAYKKHIGLYPVPSGDAAFHDAISAYRKGKGSIRIPLDKPIPYDLIEKIIRQRVEETGY